MQCCSNGIKITLKFLLNKLINRNIISQVCQYGKKEDRLLVRKIGYSYWLDRQGMVTSQIDRVQLLVRKIGYSYQLDRQGMVTSQIDRVCNECNTYLENKVGRQVTGAYEGGAGPPRPLYACPPERLRGAPMREALLILHLLAFPFLRPGTVGYLGGSSPVAPALGVPGGALPPLANTKLKGNYV